MFIKFSEWLSIREDNEGMDKFDLEAEREGNARKKFFKHGLGRGGDFIQTARGARVSRVSGLAGHRGVQTKHAVRKPSTGFYGRGKSSE